jgi:tetratricopeptide (TPR) repeat protein
VITAELGYIIAINGNRLQGSELAFTGLEIAREHNNKQALGIIYQDLAICFIGDSIKAIQYLYKATPCSEASGDYFNLAANLFTISQYYSSYNQKDSALHYAQRAYELCLSKNVNEWIPQSLVQLAKVHYYNLNNRGIAMEYLKKALATKQCRENPDAYATVNLGVARLLQSEGNTDSALYYADNVHRRLKNVRYSFWPDLYALYKKIYLPLNADSALKYFCLYETAKDSIDKLSNAQQQQLLSIKKEMESDNIARQQQKNIQYALIALGIITFIISYLMLSRRLITNTKLIQFLGVVALLLVFEFLNLVLHPILEDITHHLPVLMLLALVGIAALLVPLHHRLEQWATNKLVEKNKKIRLANAKKTIEELEIKTDDKTD